MKELNINKMEVLEGGNDTLDGICTAATIAGIAGWWTGVLTVVAIGCAAYKISEHL